MITNKEYQIFISYRRIGGEYAAKLIEYELSNMGYNVFLDVSDLLYGKYEEDIEEVLNKCDILLVLLSEGIWKESVYKDPQNDWILKEFDFVKKQNDPNKKVIFVELRNYECVKSDLVKKLIEENPNDREKVEWLHYLEEIDAYNHISYNDTRYTSAVVGRIVSHMQIQPYDSMELEEIKEKLQHDDTPSRWNEFAIKCEKEGNKDKKYLVEAYNSYIKMEDTNYPAICYNIGDIYEKCADNPMLLQHYGIEMQVSDDYRKNMMKKAIEYYIKSSECVTEDMPNGYLPAYYRIGNIYEEAGDYKQAFEYYKKAANEGRDSSYAEAYNALAFYYNNGIFVSKNAKKAEEYYKKAMQLGCIEAKYNYAHLIQNSNVQEALIIYEQCIEDCGDNHLCRYAIANCYEKIAELRKGDEFAECIGEALENYKLAYQLGNNYAEEDINRCLKILLNGLEGE